MSGKRHPLILIAAISLLATSTAWAASDPEIQALREQLMALSQRLDALEQSNQELRAENAQLQSERTADSAAIADLAETTQAVSEQLEESSAETSWTDSIRLKGDFRFRHETIDEQMKDDRRRNRIRARAAIIADVTDSVEVGLGFASGGDDPVSTNQTLGGGGSTKDINLDLAYFDWSGLTNTRILGGKFKNILYKPGKNALLWDGDWNPEGIGLAWDNDAFFVNALGTWLESDSSKETEFSYGVQAGFAHEFSAFDLTAGIAYYRIDTAGKGSFFGDDDDFFGNGFDPVTNTYLYNYHEVEVFADLGFDLAGRPFSLFFDYVQNQDAPDLDTGYAAGLKYGSAKAAGTWELGYVYQDLEADAAYGLLVDSDFGGGGTDARGHILKGGYAIAKGWNANLTYFINERYISGDDPRDYDRVQLDLYFKY
jgi:cell division protein FtsB